MPVLYKRVRTKHREFVTRTKCFYYNCSTAKKSRGVRMRKTGEGKANRNKRNAYLKRKYELYTNFDIGDLWITLTNKDKSDPDTVHKRMTEMLAKVRKKLKKKNIPFVYYAKTEAGEKTRPHLHLLVKNTSPEILGLILSEWKHGSIKDSQEIYNLQNGKLITYFLNGGNHKDLDFEKYTHSRNLEEPKIEKRLYPYDSFRKNPRPPKAEYGYKYIVRNLYNGFPDLDGFVYQEYELEKVKEEQLE